MYEVTPALLESLTGDLSNPEIFAEHFSIDSRIVKNKLGNSFSIYAGESLKIESAGFYCFETNKLVLSLVLLEFGKLFTKVHTPSRNWQVGAMLDKNGMVDFAPHGGYLDLGGMRAYRDDRVHGIQMFARAKEWYSNDECHERIERLRLMG